MDILSAALISFAGMLLLVHHLSPQWFRRLVGYKGAVDLVLHGTILYFFFGTSTLGLLQAELCGILFSVYLRGYRLLFGWEKFTTRGWIRYTGYLTRRVA